MTVAGLLPPDLSAPVTAPEDLRIGHSLVANRLGAGTQVVLIGFPSDEGVRRNGGRVGAAAGPRAIREALYRMTPDAQYPREFGDLLARTVDLGDVSVTGHLEQDQAALGDVVGPLLQTNRIPIILGGGHETAFGHFLGYVTAWQPVHLLNWDAHADVRALNDGLGHSGSPFRQALEHPAGLARGYTAAGLNPWRVAEAHAAFVQRQGRTVWVDELTEERIDHLVRFTPEPTMSSFDLDLVEAGSMPGVSAPGVGGLDVRRWLRAADACGRNPAIRSFDVVELNPARDQDGRAATLAALTVWHLLRGIALRPEVEEGGV